MCTYIFIHVYAVWYIILSACRAFLPNTELSFSHMYACAGRFLRQGLKKCFCLVTKSTCMFACLRNVVNLRKSLCEFLGLKGQMQARCAIVVQVLPAAPEEALTPASHGFNAFYNDLLLAGQSGPNFVWFITSPLHGDCSSTARPRRHAQAWLGDNVFAQFLTWWCGVCSSVVLCGVHIQVGRREVMRRLDASELDASVTHRVDASDPFVKLGGVQMLARILWSCTAAKGGFRVEILTQVCDASIRFCFKAHLFDIGSIFFLTLRSQKWPLNPSWRSFLGPKPYTLNTTYIHTYIHERERERERESKCVSLSHAHTYAHAHTCAHTHVHTHTHTRTTYTRTHARKR